MDLSSVVGLIGGVVGLVVAMGGVVAYMRGAWDKGTIVSLKESNSALSEQVAVLKGELAEEKTERAAEKALHDAEIKAVRLRIDVLEEANAELRAQRPSAEAIAAVYALCQAIHRDTQALLEAP